MSSKGNSNWSAIKAPLKRLDSNSLLSLIKDLHDLSPGNRHFLEARFLAWQGNEDHGLAPYRRRIKDAFWGVENAPKVRFRPIRKAISEYRTATSDVAGALDLMLFAVEEGTAYTNQYGDIDDAFYDSLWNLLRDFGRQLKMREHRKFYPEFAGRLAKLREDAEGIGWGYGDGVEEIVGDLERHFGETG